MLRPDLAPTHSEVDLDKQVLLVFRDGVLQLVTHVSTGSGRAYCENGNCGDALTPPGEFAYQRRIAGWRVGPPGLGAEGQCRGAECCRLAGGGIGLSGPPPVVVPAPSMLVDQPGRGVSFGARLLRGHVSGPHRRGHHDQSPAPWRRTSSASAPPASLGMTKRARAGSVGTGGNRACHVILRGGRRPNYGAEAVAAACAVLRGAGLREQVMVDVSHGNSEKQHRRQVKVAAEIAARIAAGERAISGVMLSLIHI